MDFVLTPATLVFLVSNVWWKMHLVCEHASRKSKWSSIRSIGHACSLHAHTLRTRALTACRAHAAGYITTRTDTLGNPLPVSESKLLQAIGYCEKAMACPATNYADPFNNAAMNVRGRGRGRMGPAGAGDAGMSRGFACVSVCKPCCLLMTD